MRPAGMFMYYCVITTLGFFFIKKFVKETVGLTDRQKKQLYMPKNLLTTKTASQQGQGGSEPTFDMELELTEPEKKVTPESNTETEYEQESRDNDYAPVEQETQRSIQVDVILSEEKLEEIPTIIQSKKIQESALTKEELILKKKLELQKLKSRFNK